MLTLTGISSWTDPGSDSRGVLDLRSPLKVNDEDGETEIKSVALGAALCASWSANAGNVLEFYCDIISSAGANCFKANTKVTKVEVGGSAETMPQYFLNGCTSLQTVKFNFPNLRKIEGGFISACKNPIDIATIVVPGITNIAGWTFQYSWMRGEIALTNVMTLGEGTFKNASLTKVFLAGPLTTLPKSVFNGSTITNVVLDLPNLTSISQAQYDGAFYNQSKIRRVEFISALKDMGLVTNIVRHANNGNIGDLRVYVSRNQWTAGADETYDAESNPTGFFAGKDTLTDKEKESIDEETLGKVIGVLVRGGTRKGIFVHKKSVHDPTGFFIHIR